jgi:hypothetical protein
MRRRVHRPRLPSQAGERGVQQWGGSRLGAHFVLVGATNDEVGLTQISEVCFAVKGPDLWRLVLSATVYDPDILI